MMLFDTLFDRLVGRLKSSTHQQYDESPLAPNQEEIEPQKPGFFEGAKNFVVNDPMFIDSRVQNIQNFIAGYPEANPALKQIAAYANLDATMDSSARYPPPLCHPGTRLKIGDRLFSWLINPDREWDIQWLHGPAGTGKSAVAQTFAERCDESGRLGASFFFSRLYNRNDPKTVVPSLVYQLAVCNPEYKSLVTAQLANDPELLRKKTQRAQFKKLIIEPFALLQVQGHQCGREPLLVVLDGLDECEGEGAQREIIEMISEVVRTKKKFPLIWLICSRPEEHLKCIFSRADFTVISGREELTIDAESIADVDFYLRDGLAGIRSDFPHVTTQNWPSEEQIAILSARASGHFGFAMISLRYIGDPTFATPMAQLDALLSSLTGVQAGAENPLGALDALYTGVLHNVPDEILPTIKLMLSYELYGFYADLDSVQKVCNFLHMDQITFYNTFRKLHSVLNVPSPSAASKTQLQPYHLSFKDYLRDPRRSGKFAIAKGTAWLQYSKFYLSWYKTILELFHATEGLTFNNLHKCGVLPDLKWVSDDNRAEISGSVTKCVVKWCWWTCSEVFEWDETLLSQVQNFDFRYIQADSLEGDWRDFINMLWKNSSNGFVRAAPQNEIDFTLLEYMESMIKSWWRCQPATFPLELRDDGYGGDYFFLGNGAKTVVYWTTGLPFPKPSFGMLNCNKAPSEVLVSDYHAWLNEKGAAKEDSAATGRVELGDRTKQYTTKTGCLL